MLDRSGPTLFGIPSVLYSDPSYDITEEVVKEVNKDRPPAAAVKPAAPVAAPAAPATAPAAAPAFKVPNVTPPAATKKP